MCVCVRERAAAHSTRVSLCVGGRTGMVRRRGGGGGGGGRGEADSQGYDRLRFSNGLDSDLSDNTGDSFWIFRHSFNS